MALTKALLTNYGFNAPNAYARITSFSGNKDTLAVNVDVHVNKAARDAGKDPIATFYISLPLPNGATMAQMYTALKNDSNFSDATDEQE